MKSWSLPFCLIVLVLAAPADGQQNPGYQGMTEQQIAALRALPRLDNVAVSTTGIPLLVSGSLGFLRAGERQAASLAFLHSAIAILRGREADEFRPTRQSRDKFGLLHQRFSQHYKGISIVGAELILHIDDATGEVVALNGRFVETLRLPTTPAMEASKAISGAAAQAGITLGHWLDEPVLTYFSEDAEHTYLVWAVTVTHRSEVGRERDVVFADALTGNLIARHSLVYRALSRDIFTTGHNSCNDCNANGQCIAPPKCSPTSPCSSGPGCPYGPPCCDECPLPGPSRIGWEGHRPSDPEGGSAYDNLGDVYWYFRNRHGRDSWDGGGITVLSTIRNPCLSGNAEWIPAGSGGVPYDQINFGTGGSMFGAIASDPDIASHEFTHGVTYHTAGLPNSGESGALGEAMSDIFAASNDAYYHGVTGGTWKIGELAYTPGVPSDALRYMNSPTLDGVSRDYYPERYTGGQDNGGVHWNAGIANLAFYLVVNGGTHPRGKTTDVVPAIGSGVEASIVKAEAVFYDALTHWLTSSSNFADARLQTALSAARIYGPYSAEYYSVDTAWNAVGVPRLIRY